MIRVAVVGATGYAGAEVVRLLLLHPGVEITALYSRSQAGKPFSESVGGFRGLLDLECRDFSLQHAADSADFFFLAMEAGAAIKNVPSLLGMGKKCIDLSADFRLQSRAAYRRWYKIDAAPASLLREAVYGVPEMNRDRIKTARLVANPGCYPTATILPLLPFLERDLIAPDDIVVDSKSGVSGRGRTPKDPSDNFPETNESIKPYNVAVHRHVPEMEEQLSLKTGRKVKMLFSPHLVPMQRGILSDIFCRPSERLTTRQALSILRSRYADEPFVRILGEGRWPETRFVAGSNFCDISALYDERTNRLVLVSALDNMVKGAAGQAVQCMNLMCGFEETEALKQAPLFP
jgi:N-acetyl-gamma-glutamyl-phosphate reductase